MRSRSTKIDDPGGRPSVISRGVVLAVPLFGVTILACAALASLGWWMAAIIVAALAGLTLTPLILDSVWLMLGGMVLCVFAGIMGGEIETPLFGGTVRNIRIDQAASYPWASIFHFIDGRVLSDVDGYVPVYAGSKGINHLSYERHIAPVVGDGWTPDQPITVWAVSNSPYSDMPPSDWSRPSRAGVRAISSETDDIRRVIARTGKGRNLIVSPNPVLLHWLDDPEAAVAGQGWKLFKIFCWCVALWAALVVVVRIAARIGQARRSV